MPKPEAKGTLKGEKSRTLKKTSLKILKVLKETKAQET